MFCLEDFLQEKTKTTRDKKMFHTKYNFLVSKGENTMSRSYKKVPISKDNQSCSQETKKIANRKFRRQLLDVPIKGNYYRKTFPRYLIHDWITYWSKENAREGYLNGTYSRKNCPTLEDFLNQWKKEMICK